MQTDTEVLYHCFDQIAKSDTDIAPAVYDKLTSYAPEMSPHISHMDARMKGRMLDQIYNLLLDEIDEGYLEFEARTHMGYGADTAMYRGMLRAVKDAVSDTLGDAWSDKEELAWDRSIERIVGDIEQFAYSS